MGAIIAAYVHPPQRTRVICIDEMGRISAKTYPGSEWKGGPERATFEPDYGRRGKLWVHGAFEPATGKAIILTSTRRDSASHSRLLEQMTEALLVYWNACRHPYRREKTSAQAGWPWENEAVMSRKVGDLCSQQMQALTQVPLP